MTGVAEFAAEQLLAGASPAALSGALGRVADACDGRLAQVAAVGIMQTDLGGYCTYANDRWRTLTGMTPAGAQGASWADAFHPGDVRRLIAGLARACDHGTELRTDCRLRPAGGGEIWVHLAAMPTGQQSGPAAAGEDPGHLLLMWNMTQGEPARGPA
jgi:PAS domain S-box-containing protein